MRSGVVEGIYVAGVAGTDPGSVEAVRAVAGKGLEGDRYFEARGTFSDRGPTGRDLTMIEAEAIERLAEDGLPLSPGAARRNVVTRGVALNELVGKRFRVGDVECLGRELCHPCAHLERLTAPGVLKGLASRGGLRADIVLGGTISLGAPVRPLPD